MGAQADIRDDVNEYDRLATIDLNLFVAFDALMAELSVTRAAKRVGITQSAMSHALDRLRKTFSDPILVRSPDGLLPTPRAHELIVPVRRAIAELAGALANRRQFSASTVRRTFTLAASDVGELLVVPALHARFRTISVDVDLRVQRLHAERVERQLAVGEVDVAIGSAGDLTPRALLRQRLLRDRFVCMSRREVSATTVDEFLSLDHAIYPEDPVREPRRGTRVTHLLAAILLASRTGLVLTLPERVARSTAVQFSLRSFSVPGFAVEALTLHQFWHERQAKDPEHGWFRETIAEVCASL